MMAHDQNQQYCDLRSRKMSVLAMALEHEFFFFSNNSQTQLDLFDAVIKMRTAKKNSSTNQDFKANFYFIDI